MIPEEPGAACRREWEAMLQLRVPTPSRGRWQRQRGTVLPSSEGEEGKSGSPPSSSLQASGFIFPIPEGSSAARPDVRRRGLEQRDLPPVLTSPFNPKEGGGGS